MDKVWEFKAYFNHLSKLPRKFPLSLELLIFSLITTYGCGAPSNSTLTTTSLNGVEIQEKIWQARDNGNATEAATLQATLSRVLTSGNCNQTQNTLSGVTQKVVLTCDEGIGAVVKIKQIPFPFEEPTGRNENTGIPILTGFSMSMPTQKWLHTQWTPFFN